MYVHRMAPLPIELNQKTQWNVIWTLVDDSKMKRDRKRINQYIVKQKNHSHTFDNNILDYSI